MQWEDTLEQVLERLDGLDAQWMLTGSAATALRGIDVDPHDLDLLARRRKGVVGMAERLQEWCAAASPGQEPDQFLSTREQQWLDWQQPGERWRFGRWQVDGFAVEVARIQLNGQDGALAETYGDEVWEHVERLPWRGRMVPVVALELQYVTLLRRQRQPHLSLVEQRMREHPFNHELVTRSARDRGVRLPG